MLQLQQIEGNSDQVNDANHKGPRSQKLQDRGILNHITNSMDNRSNFLAGINNPRGSMGSIKINDNSTVSCRNTSKTILEYPECKSLVQIPGSTLNNSQLDLISRRTENIERQNQNNFNQGRVYEDMPSMMSMNKHTQSQIQNGRQQSNNQEDRSLQKKQSYYPSYTEQSSRDLSRSKKKSKSIKQYGKWGVSNKYLHTSESEAAPRHLRMRSFAGAISSPTNELNKTPTDSLSFNQRFKHKNSYSQMSESKQQSTGRKKKLKRSISKSKGSLSKSRSKSRGNIQRKQSSKSRETKRSLSKFSQSQSFSKQPEIQKLMNKHTKRKLQIMDMSQKILKMEESLPKKHQSKNSNSLVSSSILRSPTQRISSQKKSKLSRNNESFQANQHYKYDSFNNQSNEYRNGYQQEMGMILVPSTPTLANRSSAHTRSLTNGGQQQSHVRLSINQITEEESSRNFEKTQQTNLQSQQSSKALSMSFQQHVSSYKDNGLLQPSNKVRQIRTLPDSIEIKSSKLNSGNNNDDVMNTEPTIDDAQMSQVNGNVLRKITKNTSESLIEQIGTASDNLMCSTLSQDNQTGFRNTFHQLRSSNGTHQSQSEQQYENTAANNNYNDYQDTQPAVHRRNNTAIIHPSQYNQIQNTSIDMMDSARIRTMHPINQLFKRMGHIEERVADAEDIFIRKHRLIQENVETICQKIEDDKNMQMELKTMRQDEIQMLNSKVEIYFQEERPKRKELESQLSAMIENRCESLRQSIIYESKSRFQQVRCLEQALEIDTPQINQSIQKLSETSDEQSNQIEHTIQNSFYQKISKHVKGERQEREDIQSRLLQLLQDTMGKVKRELQHESNERVKSTEMILGVLERQFQSADPSFQKLTTSLRAKQKLDQQNLLDNNRGSSTGGIDDNFGAINATFNESNVLNSQDQMANMRSSPHYDRLRLSYDKLNN